MLSDMLNDCLHLETGPGLSLAEKVKAQIWIELVTWRFPANAVLNEGKIAKRFGVSKSPVREALQSLVHEGVLQVVPRVGYRVTPVRIADVHEVFHLRTLLEGEAGALAATHATQDEVQKLRERKDEWTRYLIMQDKNPIAYLKYHDAFHLAIARLSGNSRLAAFIERLLKDSARIRMMDPLMSLEALKEEQVEAEAIMEALARGDSDEARRRIQKHIMESKERILERLLKDPYLSL